MTEDKQRAYYTFWNDAWQHWKKYCDGLNHKNCFEAYVELREIQDRHAHIANGYRILSEIQNSLWSIGGRQEWSQGICDVMFDTCRNAGKSYLPYLMDWLERVTMGNPERAEYIFGKLSELLSHFGTHVTDEQLKVLAEAGWLLEVN